VRASEINVRRLPPCILWIAVFDVRQTLSFLRWLAKLRDRTAKARLVRRIERLDNLDAGP